MDEKEAISIVQYIVDNAVKLIDKYTDEKNLDVDYVAIFAKDEKEYSEFLLIISKIGKCIQRTGKGELYNIKPVQTKAGKLILLKICTPNKHKLEQGYADFRVDYVEFKKKYLCRPKFRLITKETFEMIELREKGSDSLAYFPDTPLTKDLKVF